MGSDLAVALSTGSMYQSTSTTGKQVTTESETFDCKTSVLSIDISLEDYDSVFTNEEIIGDKNKPTAKNFYDKDGNLVMKEEYKYNEKGKKISATRKNADGATIGIETFDPKTGKMKQYDQYEPNCSTPFKTEEYLEYNLRGKPTKTKITERDGADENVRIENKSYYLNGKEKELIVTDENGVLQCKCTSNKYAKDGQCINYSTTTYDSKGLPEKKVSEVLEKGELHRPTYRMTTLYGSSGEPSEAVEEHYDYKKDMLSTYKYYYNFGTVSIGSTSVSKISK